MKEQNVSMFFQKEQKLVLSTTTPLFLKVCLLYIHTYYFNPTKRCSVRLLISIILINISISFSFAPSIQNYDPKNDKLPDTISVHFLLSKIGMY